MIGHCLGAAGGLEAIATLKAIETGYVHPTINQIVSSQSPFASRRHFQTSSCLHEILDVLVVSYENCSDSKSFGKAAAFSLPSGTDCPRIETICGFAWKEEVGLTCCTLCSPGLKTVVFSISLICKPSKSTESCRVLPCLIGIAYSRATRIASLLCSCCCGRLLGSDHTCLGSAEP